MTVVGTKVQWLALLAYPACGLALGLADPVLGQAAAWLGARPGLATAVSVNLLLPLVAVVLAVRHGRIGGACLGAVALTLGFFVGLAVQYPAGIVAWSPWGLLRSVPPVLVLGGMGYAVLGSVAALAGRAWRRLTEADAVPEDGC
jgi:hypothetical protein